MKEAKLIYDCDGQDRLKNQFNRSKKKKNRIFEIQDL